jgi:hypothetical protein
MWLAQWRVVALAGSLAPMLVGCVQAGATPGHAPTATVVAARPPAGAPACIEGWLTQKGPDPGTYWAISETAGTVWQLLLAGPAWQAMLQALAGQRVAVRGAAEEGWVPQGYRPTEVRIGRCDGTRGDDRP